LLQNKQYEHNQDSRKIIKKISPPRVLAHIHLPPKPINMETRNRIDINKTFTILGALHKLK